MFWTSQASRDAAIPSSCILWKKNIYIMMLKLNFYHFCQLAQVLHKFSSLVSFRIAIKEMKNEYKWMLWRSAPDKTRLNGQFQNQIDFSSQPWIECRVIIAYYISIINRCAPCETAIRCDTCIQSVDWIKCNKCVNWYLFFNHFRTKIKMSYNFISLFFDTNWICSLFSYRLKKRKNPFLYHNRYGAFQCYWISLNVPTDATCHYSNIQ